CSAEETQDTTRAILGDILEQTKAAEKKKTETDGGISKEETVVHVRVHKRIATTPIGLPISKAKSVPELLIIVADVMRCHHAIYEECRILHRDVSINNIMFCRTPGGGVAGLLIDFDHAMDEEHENDKPHDMRTGTMPYMSINNLENSSTKCTVLDDWESLIYILCWIGTYGYNSGTRCKYMPSKPLRIRQWDTGNMMINADSKRISLHSTDTFSQITSEFNKELPGCELLIYTVDQLRTALVNPKDLDEVHGTIIQEDTSDSDDSSFELPMNSHASENTSSACASPTTRVSARRLAALSIHKDSEDSPPIPLTMPERHPVNSNISADPKSNDPIAMRVPHASAISQELLK
ncbi:hypothetical protein LPJ64_006433, partial [Coemansia asiatica]